MVYDLARRVSQGAKLYGLCAASLLVPSSCLSLFPFDKIVQVGTEGDAVAKVLETVGFCLNSETKPPDLAAIKAEGVLKSPRPINIPMSAAG